MEILSKSDYISWRDSEVTKVLFSELTDRVEEVANELLNRESPNLDRDQFIKGFVNAAQQVLTWRPTLVEDLQEENVQ